MLKFPLFTEHVVQLSWYPYNKFLAIVDSCPNLVTRHRTLTQRAYLREAIEGAAKGYCNPWAAEDRERIKAERKLTEDMEALLFDLTGVTGLPNTR